MSFAKKLHSKSSLVRRLGLLRQSRWRRDDIGEILVKGREQIENIFKTTANHKFNQLLVSDSYEDYGFLADFKSRCRLIRRVDPAVLYEIVYQSRPVVKTEFLKGESSADLLRDSSVADSLMLATMAKPSFVLPSTLRLVLCLDGVVFPENVGALIRTAASIGAVDAIVATSGSCDFHGWKVLEASKGFGFDIPKLNIGDSLAQFVQDHSLVPLVGSPNVEGGEKIISLDGNVIVILGNEKHGPSQQALSLSNAVHYRLPTSAAMSSLNAAVAGGLLLQIAKSSQLV